MLRIIDTETCGLQGGIVEIASVDVIDGKIVNPMSHLVRPDRPISPQAMAIHRITEAKAISFHYARLFGLEHAMLRIIDTETCGLQGGIVEIASVDVIDGKIVNPMSHLVRPDRPISPQAMAIHRITEAMVADKPWMIASVDVIDGKIVNPMSHLVRPDRPISPQAMAIHRITEAMVADKPWIGDVIPHYYGSEWYVAHNASFDRRVLPEMPGEWICTMKLARRLWPGIKYSNMALYKTRKLNVQTPPGLHHLRALYDCYITAALLIDIMNTSGWTAEQMADITGRPSLMTTFTFGKYRGKAVSDVAERDPGYLRWLFNNLDSMSPELRLTLKQNTSGWTAEQMADITGRPSLMTTFTFGKYRGKAVSDVAERDPGYLRWLFNNLDSMSPELRLTLKHYLENT